MEKKAEVQVKEYELANINRTIENLKWVHSERSFENVRYSSQ